MFITKFVPAQGKIRRGDRVVDPKLAPKDGFDYLGGDTFRNMMGDELDLPDWEKRFDFVRLELFLCSTDVVPGDIVKVSYSLVDVLDMEYIGPDEADPSFGKVKIVGDTSTRFSGYFHKYIYKTIAKVSENAREFVKDGMTFEPDQFRVVKSIKLEIFSRAHRSESILELGPDSDDFYKKHMKQIVDNWIEEPAQYGIRKADWDDTDIFVSKVEFKCSNCKHFH